MANIYVSGVPGRRKGKPRSGRVWKSYNQSKPASSMKQGPAFRATYAHRMRLKEEAKATRELDRCLKDANKKTITDYKERRAQNIKRNLENARRGEVVQRITNTSKLRRMSKKQLKRIEKR